MAVYDMPGSGHLTPVYPNHPQMCGEVQRGVQDGSLYTRDSRYADLDWFVISLNADRHPLCQPRGRARKY